MRTLLGLLGFLGGVVLGAAGLGVWYLEVPLVQLATVGTGALCLGWLLIIVVLPWNLYFQARRVALEAERSQARGIAAEVGQAEEARGVAKRTLRVAVALHLGSAALLALGAWLYQARLGYAFAGLFLLATWFRPGVEWYRALRARLSQLFEEVRYPRADVRTLVEEVRRLAAESVAQAKGLEALGGRVTKSEEGWTEAHRDTRVRLEAIARRFEETIDRLTDNQEVITGIKAFLRLVRGGAERTPGRLPEVE